MVTPLLRPYLQKKIPPIWKPYAIMFVGRALYLQESERGKKLYQKHLFRRQQRIEATISDRQTAVMASEAEE